MRKTVFFIFALLLSATAHCQKFNPTEGSHVVYQVPQYVEPNWYEGANELCPKDQWMRITDEMRMVCLIMTRSLSWLKCLRLDNILLCCLRFGKPGVQWSPFKWDIPKIRTSPMLSTTV